MDFKVELEKLNISLDNDMLNKFELYYNKLIEVNSYMNLTAITEKDQVYLKHFYDSLTITKAISGDNYNILDVGAGAGFPSVPLAIVKPNVNVTIIDSLNKRINFLNDLTKYIGIDNVVALHQRAEEYIKDKRESFDYVTARAVARLNVLSELCIPYVKVGGYFVALKGNDKEQYEAHDVYAEQEPVDIESEVVETDTLVSSAKIATGLVVAWGKVIPPPFILLRANPLKFTISSKFVILWSTPFLALLGNAPKEIIFL